MEFDRSPIHKRTLSCIISLFLLLFHLTINAQTDILRDERVDAVLKQVAAKRSGLHIYSRKDIKNGYVNMAVLDDSTRQLKWFTCHGVVFDAVLLSTDEYKQLVADKLDPFSFYQHYCHKKLYSIEQAELLYRLHGEMALKDTVHNNRIIFNTPPVKSAATTLQKLIAIEGLMKGLYLRLQVFGSRSPRLLTQYRNDSSHVQRELAGTMIRNANSTEYHNIDPIAGATRIVLRRQSPDKLFVFDQRGALVDSVPLKPGKYAALFQEKEDVFLLYRGWLELQWQQAADNRQQYASWLGTLDSSLYRPAAWAERRHQIRNALIGLNDQLNTISDKITNLIVPTESYAAWLIADAYKEETSEISYLPGLGFAYNLSYSRGHKVYELTDHRDNVVAAISDKKKNVDGNTDGVIDYYNADVVSASDYYP